MVEIFSLPGEMPFDLAGDTVTEDLGKILASVSGGDPAGMAQLIENERANPYVRAAAMGGLLTLVSSGMRTREEIVEYFRSLFHKLDRRPGDTWAWLASACADLWPGELMEDLQLAWNEGLIEAEIVDWGDIEEDLRRGKEECLRDLARKERLITNVVKEMQWWACFRRENVPEFQTHKPVGPVLSFDAFVADRPAAKIGRNDPCPCLSGKKFKKCCGG